MMCALAVAASLWTAAPLQTSPGPVSGRVVAARDGAGVYALEVNVYV